MKKKKRRLRAVTEVLAQAMAERDDLAYRLAHAEQDANGARAALAAATRGAAKMAAERDEAQRQVAEVLEVLDLACTRTARAPDGSPRTPAQRVRLLVEQLQQPADALEMLRLEALRRQRDEARRSHDRTAAETLAALAGLGSADGPALAQALGINVTTAYNRLARLHAAGLVGRVKVGRRLAYAPMAGQS